jgi:hypothetical protein
MRWRERLKKWSAIQGLIMMRRWISFSMLIGVLFQGYCLAGEPEKTRSEKVRILVDVTEAPKLKEWAEKARVLCEKWYPIISDELKTEGVTPPKTVRLVFKKDMKGIAGTSGSTIEISSTWVRENPDDFGMVIHELTHVVQGYPDYEPVWLIEGIADYVRFWKFEPKEKRPKIDPLTADFRKGYQTAAAFLAWIVENQDKKAILKLNKALRKGNCKESVFKEIFGKEVDQLWKDFLADQAKN